MINSKRIIAGTLAIITIFAANCTSNSNTFFNNSNSFTVSAANNITWSIDANGVMTISGSGDMPTYFNEMSYEWHSERSKIKKIVIESGITLIPCYAFSSCPNLTSVSIPNTVTLIRESAFRYDSNLTSVTIPSSVKTIWNCAFANTGLTEVSVPDSVTELEGAFQGCSKLKKAVLPSGLQILYSCTFSECPELTDVTIPSTVTKIGYGAFLKCPALASITIPESVTEIEDNAFFNCTKLKNIDIPASVKIIGANSFQGCSSLESVKIENAEAVVDSGAFSACPKLTKFDCPEGVTFADDAFIGDTSLNAPFAYTLYEGTEWGFYTTDVINWKITSDGTLYISGTTRMREGESTASFTSGWNHDKQMRDRIKKIVINEGVQSTAIRGFERLNNLEEVVLPSTVTHICRSSFADNPKLKRINFPEKLTQIDPFAFYGCEQLSDFTLPKSLEKLGEASFYCCRPVKEITIPSGVKEIPKDCFAGCNDLEKLTLNEGLTSIGFQAFFACGMESVDIPDTVTTIDKNGFIDCPNLKNVNFSDNSQLTSIGENAFYQCSSLREFAFPDGVKTVESGVLAYCDKLTDVYLNKVETIKSLDSSGYITSPFAFCYNLKKLYIPMTVKEIEKSSFYSNKYLDTIIYCGTKDDWENISIGENNRLFNEFPQFHDYHYDVCSYCQKHKDSENARFSGYSLTLDGSIGVNLYLTLDDEITSDPDAYIKFITPDGTSTKIKVSDAKKDTVEGKEYYVFTCHVSAKDMSRSITAQIVQGDSAKVDSYTFTVTEYANALGLRDHAKYDKFVEAFINYGNFADCYFSNTTDYKKNYTDADYARVISGITPSTGITDEDYIGSSLLLKSNIVLRHYFSEYKEGRKEKYGSNTYYVEKTFSPLQLDKFIDNYKYSVYDYIYKVLNSEQADKSLKMLCVALYDYAEACKTL